MRTPLALLVASFAALLVLAYSILIVAQPILGVLVAGVVLVVGVLTATDMPPDRQRSVVTWVVVGIVLAYGVVSQQFLMGVLVGAVVYYVAWRTGPAATEP
ncbi:hypothetical protein ACFQH6_10765 [Halobacteriaceae archaeon GCM10025711]